MNRNPLTLLLGLTAALAGTSAFANTGIINFEGRIISSTCPIEVVNPIDGSIGGLVKMGSIDASRFTAIGQEYSGKSFALRVGDSAGCNLDPSGNTATVTFNGTADSSGNYFAVTPTADGATGVVITIKDLTGASVAPGTPSSEYNLNDPGAGPTDMNFNAYYRSTATAVTAGAASADVQFIVAIN